MSTSASPKRKPQVSESMEELKSIHAKRIWLDATSIIGLVFAVVATTWTISAERNDINTKLDTLSKQVNEITLKQIELKGKTKDRWTRSDMQQLLSDWCYRAEKENTKWSCPRMVINTLTIPDSPDGPQ